MPMPHETNFQWRPNDNGSITNHRYDIEADKWYKSFKSAAKNNKDVTWGTFTGDLGAIGMVLSIPLTLFLLVFIMAPLYILRYVIGYSIKVFPGDDPTGWVKKEDPMAKYRVDYEKFGVDGDEFRARARANARKYQPPTDVEMKDLAAFIYQKNAEAETKLKTS